MTIQITDSIGGVVSTVVDRVWTGAGEHTLDLDGAALPDGTYNVVVTAGTATGVSVQKLIPLSVNRTLGLVSVAPLAFSPNGDGRKDRLTLTFALTAPADVRIRVERDGRWVASPLLASYLPGTQRFVWDGVRATGLLRDGEYTAVVEATQRSRSDLVRRAVRRRLDAAARSHPAGRGLEDQRQRARRS